MRGAGAMPSWMRQNMPASAEASLTSLGNQPVSGLLSVDARHSVTACSEGFCAVHGGCDQPRQIVGLPYHAVLVLLAKKVGIAGADAVECDSKWPNTVYRRYLDGEEAPFLTRLADGRWIEIEQTRLDGSTIITWRDITAPVLAMVCLSDALQGAPEGLSLWDQRNRLTRANDAFAQILRESGLATEPRMPAKDLFEQLEKSLPLSAAGKTALQEMARAKADSPPRTFLIGLTDGRVLIMIKRPLASGGQSLSVRWAAEQRVDRLPAAQEAEIPAGDAAPIEWPMKPARKRLLGGGLLLGDAMDTAAAKHNVEGGHLNHPPVGENRLKNRAGGVILWHGEGRHH